MEAKQKEIAATLSEMKPLPDVPRSEVESHLEEWRRMLRGSVTQGRLVLQKILKGRLVMMPLKNGAGYEFSAPTRFDKLFRGLALPMPKFVEGMDQSNEGYEHLTPADTGDEEKDALLSGRAKEGVSPTGFEPVLLP